jgi:N-acetyl sugar amidotransferase
MKPIPFPEFSVPAHDTQARYNLPTQIEFCRRCVISNQRPRISFDAEGVCSACRFAEIKRSQIDWAQRERELAACCDKFRRNDGRFDVIVPCSGGKDSGYVSHVLKTKYGMHPLTVTWAPHWYTDIGRDNLASLIHSGFDNICFTPNGQVHRLMTRLAFVNVGDPFQPFIYGQKNFPLLMAAQFDVPLIMYGENGEVEYGGDMKNAFSPTHDLGDDMIKHYFSGIGPEEWAKHGVGEADLRPYCGPTRQALERTGVECHFMGYYHKWIPQELFYYCSENTGFRANDDGRSEGTYSKYASLDDRLDGFHYYLAFIKFGIGRCTSDAAHEIRDGHLTREEGVALVRRFDGEFPKKYFHDFLEYTGLTESQFTQVIDAWRAKHVWQRNGAEWALKRAVWHEQELATAGAAS